MLDSCTAEKIPSSMVAPAISALAGILAAIMIAISLGLSAPLLPSAGVLSAAFAELCTAQTDRSYAMASVDQRPKGVAEVVSTEKLSHVPGKNITVVRVKFPPGGWSPKHYHGGSVTVYVLAGTVRSQIEGLPPTIYNPGESFFEPLGAVHLYAENISNTEPAEILAVFIHDEGAVLTTYF